MNQSNVTMVIGYYLKHFVVRVACLKFKLYLNLSNRLSELLEKVFAELLPESARDVNFQTLIQILPIE